LHFKSVDTNGDGHITREEALKLGRFTIAVLKAAFSLGIQSQAAEMRKAGLKEV
jgi:hypothetical protein